MYIYREFLKVSDRKDSYYNPNYRYHTLGKRATPEEETAEFLNDWVDFKVQHISGVGSLVFDLPLTFRATLSTRLETSPVSLTRWDFTLQVEM